MTSGWRVLIVDDDPDSRDVIGEALQIYPGDVDIIEAETGEMALNRLTEDVPTLLVIDLALPDLDGWALHRRIRSDPAFSTVPIVAVTAYGSPRVAQEAAREGFDAYIDKPIDIHDFGKKLETILLS